jgi:muramoyltetrapeptide carboxypeptidase
MSAIRKPKALRGGDLIGVASPAGPVEEDRLERGVAELEALGFSVRVAMGALDRTGFTAGSPETRQGQLEGLLADPEVAGIVCARGGAGAGRVLARLNTALLRENPKPLVGYSDITWLHLGLGGLGIPSLHGPMAARELADGEKAYDRESLWHALTGEGEPYESAPGSLEPLQDGSAEGVLRGGCLSILAAAAGTPWALRTAGEPTVLFLEDVDEPPYRVDRTLLQLEASGALEGVQGVVFGAMKGCAPEPDADYTLRDVLLEALEDLEIPIAVGLASGHTSGPNITLPLGVRVRLDCGGGEARFEVLEAAVE